MFEEKTGVWRQKTCVSDSVTPGEGGGGGLRRKLSSVALREASEGARGKTSAGGIG